MNKNYQEMAMNQINIPIDTLVKLYFDKSLMVDRKYERRLLQELIHSGVMQQRAQNGYFDYGIVIALSKDASGNDKFIIRSGLHKLQYIIRYVLDTTAASGYEEFMRSFKNDRLKSPSDRRIIMDRVHITMLLNFMDGVDDILCSMYQKPVYCDGVAVGNMEVQKMICRIASAVRGDNTTNRVVPLYNLEEQTIVPMISKTDIGISFQETFWGKFSLMNFEELWDSADEAVIFSLYKQLISNPWAAAVEKCPLNEVESRFIRVFDMFEAIYCDKELFAFLPSEKNMRCFKSVILALYMFDSKGGELADYDKTYKFLQTVMSTIELLCPDTDYSLFKVALLILDLLTDKFGVA